MTHLRAVALILFILFIFGPFLQPIWAAPPQKVVLMTSFDPDASASERGARQFLTRPFEFFYTRAAFEKVRSDFEPFLEKIEERFRATFKKTPYLPEVYHYADQYHLASVLDDPTVVALYWLSHAQGPSWLSLFSSAALYSADKFEVTPLFQKVGPNLRVLTVYSCYSWQSVYPVLIKHHILENNPDLLLFTYPVPVSPEAEVRPGYYFLQEAFDLGKEHLIEMESKAPAHTIPLKITRQCTTVDTATESPSDGKVEFPAVRVVSHSGKVLATLPRCAVGEVIEASGFLDQDEPTYTLTVSLGRRPDILRNTPYRIGVFHFETHSPLKENHDWQVFQSNGKPIGVTQNVYRYENLAAFVH